MRLSASLVRSDLWNLKTTIEQLEFSGIDYLHLDYIESGLFPNCGLPLKMIVEAPSRVRPLIDIHLMANKPEKLISGLQLRKQDQISVQFECLSAEEIDLTIKQLQKTGGKVGLAFGYQSPINLVREWINIIDFVVVMGIPTGTFGLPLQPGILEKVSEIATWREEHGYSFQIEVDGGINTESVKNVKMCGADIIVCGSIIFNSDNIIYSVERLRSTINSSG